MSESKSGMEIAMIRVLRQLPRNMRIISEVRSAAMPALANHALQRGPYEERLIELRCDDQLRGQCRFEFWQCVID